MKKIKNKYLLALGATIITIAPLATVIACDNKNDDLDFDAVSKDEFVFTNDKIKNEVVPLINEVEDYLLNELHKHYPVAEDDYGRIMAKLAYFSNDDKTIKTDAEKKIEELNTKISKFEQSIAGTNFNTGNKTYQKLKEYQHKLPQIIESTSAGIWAFIYQNLYSAALSNQLVYGTDNLVADKTQVTGENIYWVDQVAVQKLFDDIDAANAKVGKPLTTPLAAGATRTWNEVLKGILSNAAGNPTDEEQPQPEPRKQVEWIENWINKNLVVWDGKNAVSASIKVHVERGNVASPVDVAKLKALVKDGQKNIKYDKSALKLELEPEWFIPDQNHFFIPSLDNSIVLQLSQDYKDYMTKKYTTPNSNFEPEDSEDYYKLIDEIAKDRNTGKQSLEILKTEVIGFKQLSDLGVKLYTKLVSYINTSTKVFFTTEESDPNNINNKIILPGENYVDKSVVQEDDVLNAIAINVKSGAFDALKPASGWQKINASTNGDTDSMKLKEQKGVLESILINYGERGLEFILRNLLFPYRATDWNTMKTKVAFGNFGYALSDGWILRNNELTFDKQKTDKTYIGLWTNDLDTPKNEIAFDDDEDIVEKLRSWENSLQANY